MLEKLNNKSTHVLKNRHMKLPAENQENKSTIFEVRPIRHWILRRYFKCVRCNQPIIQYQRLLSITNEFLKFHLGSLESRFEFYNPQGQRAFKCCNCQLDWRIVERGQFMYIPQTSVVLDLWTNLLVSSSQTATQVLPHWFKQKTQDCSERNPVQSFSRN